MNKTKRKGRNKHESIKRLQDPTPQGRAIRRQGRKPRNGDPALRKDKTAAERKTRGRSVTNRRGTALRA